MRQGGKGAREMNQDWAEDKTQRAWNRLWVATQPDTPHPVDMVALGMYAAMLRSEGGDAAASAFPDIDRHVRDGCATCDVSIKELADFFAEEERSISGPVADRWLPALLAHAWTYSAQTTAAF